MSSISPEKSGDMSFWLKIILYIEICMKMRYNMLMDYFQNSLCIGERL